MYIIFVLVIMYGAEIILKCRLKILTVSNEAMQKARISGHN